MEHTSKYPTESPTTFRNISALSTPLNESPQRGGDIL